jgi:hypothetical protein
LRARAGRTLESRLLDRVLAIPLVEVEILIYNHFLLEGFVRLDSGQLEYFCGRCGARRLHEAAVHAGC